MTLGEVGFGGKGSRSLWTANMAELGRRNVVQMRYAMSRGNVRGQIRLEWTVCSVSFVGQTNRRFSNPIHLQCQAA